MTACDNNCLRCAEGHDTEGCHLLDLEVVRIKADIVLEEDAALEMWRDEFAPAGLTANITGKPGKIIVIETPDGAPQIAVGNLPRSVRAPYRNAALNYPTSGSVMRSAGVRNRAQVFGFLGPNPVLRRMTCCDSSGANSHPQQHAVLISLASYLASLLKVSVPEQYDINTSLVSEVNPAWLMPGGLWTSGVLNETSQLPYHRDRNNFVGSWSAMPTIRRNARGGYLHFPELEVDGAPAVAACADGDVLLFNGQRWMHGVTPIEKTAKDGYRFSSVYYAVHRMRHCLDPEANLRRAQEARTRNEDTLLDRQRKTGLIKE